LEGLINPGPFLVGVPSETGVDLQFVPIDDLPIGVIQTLAAVDYIFALVIDGPVLIRRAGNAVLDCDGCVIGVGGAEAFGIGEGGVDDLVVFDDREGTRSDGGDGGH